VSLSTIWLVVSDSFENQNLMQCSAFRPHLELSYLLSPACHVFVATSLPFSLHYQDEFDRGRHHARVCISTSCPLREQHPLLRTNSRSNAYTQPVQGCSSQLFRACRCGTPAATFVRVCQIRMGSSPSGNILLNSNSIVSARRRFDVLRQTP
jgi:hypothetical protein